MKPRHWILLGAVILALAVAALLLLPGEPAPYAVVSCQGQRWGSIDLTKDATYTITTELGTNVLTVKNGSIEVSQADCPGQDCVKMGSRSGGAPIVCLPHEVVITFSQEAPVDGGTR